MQALQGKLQKMISEKAQKAQITIKIQESENAR